MIGRWPSAYDTRISEHTGRPGVAEPELRAFKLGLHVWLQLRKGGLKISLHRGGLVDGRSLSVRLSTERRTATLERSSRRESARESPLRGWKMCNPKVVCHE